jgi:hypothetical protein
MKVTSKQIRKTYNTKLKKFSIMQSKWRMKFLTDFKMQLDLKWYELSRRFHQVVVLKIGGWSLGVTVLSYNCKHISQEILD